jgi:hypothetical protein
MMSLVIRGSDEVARALLQIIPGRGVAVRFNVDANP